MWLQPTELNSSPWLLWVEAVEDHPQVFLAAGAILAFIIAAKVMLALRSELQDEERETLRKKQQEQESTGRASTTDESAKSK